MDDAVKITNVPNALITTKPNKKGDSFSNIRFKYAPSVGGNGYGVLRVPSSSVTETSPKFSRVELDPNKRYGIYHTDAEGIRQVDWMYAGDVKNAFNASRTPKESVPKAPAQERALPDYEDCDDLSF